MPVNFFFYYYYFFLFFFFDICKPGSQSESWGFRNNISSSLLDHSQSSLCSLMLSHSWSLESTLRHSPLGPSNQYLSSAARTHRALTRLPGPNETSLPLSSAALLVRTLTWTQCRAQCQESEIHFSFLLKMYEETLFVKAILDLHQNKKQKIQRVPLYSLPQCMHSLLHSNVIFNEIKWISLQNIKCIPLIEALLDDIFCECVCVLLCI